MVADCIWLLLLEAEVVCKFLIVTFASHIVTVTNDGTDIR